MMLEGLVAWVLNNYLGKYVENLNTDQLSVALLSGKVELENLPLRKDALRHLGLPVEVVAGFIGRVQLQVPVRQIRSAPWLIYIDKLYLVAAPLNLDDWDSGAEAVWAHERKLATLNALETAWRTRREAQDSYYAASYSSWMSYGATFIAPILENLQLKLTDVHIRYEDGVSCGGGCACGLTIGSLAGAGQGESGDGFKLFELKELALYWDPMPASQRYAECTVNDLMERMGSAWSRPHRFVLQPAGAAARVRRDRSARPLRARDAPRLEATLTLHAVELSLDARQYGELVSCWRWLERLGRVRALRAGRPAVPLRGHARQYWLYALRCHSHAYRWTESRPTWQSCVEASRRARAYVTACTAQLSSPTATLSPALQRDKDDYEWNTDLDILTALREVAMRKAEVPKSSTASTPEKPVGRSALVQWFPAWWGWHGAAEPGDQPMGPPPPEEELLDAIADSLDNDSMLKRDVLFGRFEFLLTTGCLKLSGEPDEESGDDDQWETKAPSDVQQSPGLELEFTAVRLCVEWRPRGGALSLGAAVGGIWLREHLSPRSLFPLLAAPHGLVREGLARLSQRVCRDDPLQQHTQHNQQEPLFQLTFEKKPFGLNCEYKLWVKSTSLEVVWSAEAASWALQWARGPFRAEGVGRGAAGRARTAQRLISQLGHMMQGERRAWHLELDISAPQILLVEDLCDRDGAVMVVDFGRLRLANAEPPQPPPPSHAPPPDWPEEEDAFLTPCSTPPASPQSPPAPPPQPSLDARGLHDSLYDRYKIELSDLQILVGRARDNWKYAHTRASSSLHLLDRFSILLQAERRVVCTSDPMYPLATVRGSLPAMVAHLSEQRLLAVRGVLAAATLPRSPTGPPAPPPPPPSPASPVDSPDHTATVHTTTLFMLHFAIDQVSIEVQSLGRSIAEVQVGGARCQLALRPGERSLALSVHSLLLVDALQTYGPDFELLVASHKHLGMDTTSGSIRGSEPTSPTSPASPTSTSSAAHAHPRDLQQALHSLHGKAHTGQQERDRTSSAHGWYMADGSWGSAWGASGGTWGPVDQSAPGGWGPDSWGATGVVDSEALIALELTFVKGDGDSEDLRIANILFNNLDIIANQETIVELIGFVQRVAQGPVGGALPSPAPASPDEQPHVEKETRTEITFDFHRLGVLLVRAAVLDGALVANKIATATVSEAKIQATLDSCRVEVGGSLGGVQVVSLCEGAGLHARVLAAGRAPPRQVPAHELHHDNRALLFSIARTLTTADEAADDTPGSAVVQVMVTMHVARVWYTHSGALLRELQSCLTEFKQYLANLARSIRAAAHDMAVGLVQPRGESLYANPKLSQSMEGVSPRRRTTSIGYSLDDPPDLTPEDIVLTVSVELESPVVVVPRAADSAQVLVAHLGRMSLDNRPGPPHRSLYRIRLRDISLAAVDVSERLKTFPLCAENMSEIYCAAAGAAIVHDTAIRLSVSYCAPHIDATLPDGLCEVSGSIVGALQVSAAREQYEQILETARWVTGAAATPPTHTHQQEAPPPSSTHKQQSVSALCLVEGAVPTLRLDPTLRAAVLAVPPPRPLPTPSTPLPLKVLFSVPMVTVCLRGDLGAGERSLVQLAVSELSACYHRGANHTTLQVSLHSVRMEDLSQPPQSKHRVLMVSHTPPKPPKAVFLSKSCPDFLAAQDADDVIKTSLLANRNCYSSLPSQLNVIDRPKLSRAKQDSQCGATPPCSPEPNDGGLVSEDEGEPTADDNLVWINVHTRAADHPDLHTKYNNVTKLTRVDFNCLNLVVSIDSWVAVLDFFGVTGDEDDHSDENDGAADATPESDQPVSQLDAAGGITQTETSVRSLSVVVVRGGLEVCRALVSRARVVSRADAASRTRRINGRLAALALHDLTPRSPLWRDRFRTHTDQALTFQYQRLSASEAQSSGHETSLQLTMGPVSYVHTKRFVQQLQAFASDFSRLRAVIAHARRKVSVGVGVGGRDSRAQRMRLRVRCTAPAIVVPVSGRARAALSAELDQLSVDNCFQINEAGELLDVRTVSLSGLSLWAARGGSGAAGGGRARRQGPPLLAAPATLQLTVTTNMGSTHSVPDTSISGTLTTLSATLDPAQYRLVRGVLAHNLGDDTADLQPAPTHPQHHTQQQHQHQPTHQTQEQVWTVLSLSLDLQDVSVRLEPAHGCSLACINFIKSRLLVESYSDLGMDIDLVSQEILVSDTRYAHEPANRRGNVFSHIVQPLPDHRHTVQAEVHARKRRDSSAYTILVNNMRLMAVLDWWEAANQFLMQSPPPAADHDQPNIEEVLPYAGAASPFALDQTEDMQVELKLNVTDSQLVLVEDASVWDTNAVILKSTTVITYRGARVSRPVVCEVSSLEVFSCVLGLEEETALPILEPAKLTAALTAQRELTVELHSLLLRLSYHDMRMFAAMARSLPLQARALQASPPPANRPRRPGPSPPVQPLWPRRTPPAPTHDIDSHLWPIKSVQVTAEAVVLCVIDDCQHSDVPLLELALSSLQLYQDLRKPEESFEDPILVQTPASAPSSTSRLTSASSPTAAPAAPSGAGGGRLTASLSADYYNRALSGWEPVVEPWSFECGWEYTLTGALRLARAQTEVTSRSVLDVNVTAALMELATLVRGRWTADLRAPPADPKGSPPRRRAPFVPYALSNHTGHRLWFTTVLTTCDKLEESPANISPMVDDTWVAVRAGETEPFSFGARRGRGRGGARGGAVHPLHRLAIRLDHWLPAEPVCVDRVGVFYRELQHAAGSARAYLVLAVTLEDSARKLVTVRSALQLTNRLPHPVEVRVDANNAHTPGATLLAGGGVSTRVRDHCAAMARARADLTPFPVTLHAMHALAIDCAQWNSTGLRMANVCPGETWAAPLGAVGALWARPLIRGALPFAPTALDWRTAPALLATECHAPPDQAYRFCVSVVREPFPTIEREPLPGHTLTLLPALRLLNLLPVELVVRAAAVDDSTPRVLLPLPPAADHPFTELNIEEGVELSIKLEGFGWSSPLSVGGGGLGGGAQAFGARLKLRDARGRRLYLSARVTCDQASGVAVAVSAAYWLINRTGLPLVFRAEGATQEAAGQFDEHEVARMVAPLPFAFAEAEGGPTLQARLGRGAAGPQPDWSAPFGLGAGHAKRLEVRADQRVYSLGVEARAGRHRYRHTHMVTLAPRHQLHNTTPYLVQFAQKCCATTVSDPGACATHALAPPGCCLPWHWPRADREPLLCARLMRPATPGSQPAALTAWSGGFRIDASRTLHIACRETGGGCSYTVVRVEVAAAGGSLLTVLSALDASPPPLRIDNYSAVAVMLHQAGCGEECVVGAHAALQWALPEPEGTQALALRAPGGPRVTLPLDALPNSVQLVYQNFLYVAFTATLGNPEGALVLEVPAGSTRVLLARKRQGDRAQLWRRGPQGQLVHEGSGPPSGAGAAPDEEAPLPPHACVLDIEDAAPRPPRPAALVLRRADQRRQSTQSWRLLAPARMGCAHANLCVQPEGGLMGLAAGRRAVLALPRGPIEPVPPEQAVGWHSLRPGSGRLDVSLVADGPTRLVRVRDHKAPDGGWVEGGDVEEEQSGAWSAGGREWGVRVALAGLGVSLVGRAPPAELVYLRLTGVALEISARAAALAVHDMQWDNQLAGSLSPVLLHTLPASPGTPALTAAAELAGAPRRYRALYFHHLMVALRPLAVRLEERLMLALYAWAAPEPPADEGPDDDAAARYLVTEITSHNATRCYFALIKIMPSQIRLSMSTAAKLEGSLGALKRQLALTLIRFEDAAVELEPFVRAHAYDTPAALARHVALHFKDELKWQAAKILGSVDFLGNPLGFVADVSEGVSGLLLEGNVGALVTHVAHGISDSAAKVSSSLGDGLQRVVGDDAHEETRRRIRQGASGAHLSAGLRGLGLGLLGGVTSLVKHTYEGAAADGLAGLLAGVGKGLVGTVTKPVIGVLDLASEAASALRDTSRRGGRGVPDRVRSPRCAAAAGSLLPRYCPQQAGGAHALLALNGGDTTEHFLSYGTVRGPPHDIRALLSTTFLRIFTAKHGAPQIVMETHLSNLVSCSVVESQGSHLVELGVRGGGCVRRPRVQCDSAELAAWLARHAAYARQLHREHAHSLTTHT